MFLINLNPLTAPSPEGMHGLDPQVLYEFKIDTDGDYVADLAYKISVHDSTSGRDGTQALTLYRATGAEADTNVVAGQRVAQGTSTAFDASVPEVITGTNGELVFVGPRQDPFFFNFKGVLSPVALDLRFALSADGLPTDGTAATTAGKAFSAWATTSIDGRQQDRCGKLSVTAIFLPQPPLGRNPNSYPYGGLKQTYNETKPDADVANYAEAFEYRLYQVQVDSSKIDSVRQFFLPDVLRYDPAQTQSYPNGRNLSEDAVYWTIRYLNPFMVETDSTLQLPASNPQPLTSEFPYAAAALPGAITMQNEASACPWWHLPCLLRRVLTG